MRRIQKSLLGLILLIVVIHLLVPPILRQGVNRCLQTIPDYDGHVDSIRFGWVTPSLTAGPIKLSKRDQTAPGADVFVESIQARFFWTALLRGRLVLDVTLEKPRMVFLMRERRVGQAHPSGVWRKPFERFPPFRVDKLALHDGVLEFKNDDALPPIHTSFNAVQLTATSIANRARLVESRTVTVQGQALMQGQARLSLTVTAKPFREHVDLDLQGTLNDFKLPLMNDILRYYTGLELRKGTLKMRMKLAIRNGAFSGQVQRTIDQLTIKKADRGFIKSIKENAAQAWLNEHKNSADKRLEKEFTYAGPLGYLDQDPLLAAVWVTKGAFIQSLKANLNDDVHSIVPEEALDQWAKFQAKQRKKAGRTD